MEAAWAVVAAVSARAEKCVSPFSHYKPTADLTPFDDPFRLLRNTIGLENYNPMDVPLSFPTRSARPPQPLVSRGVR